MAELNVTALGEIFPFEHSFGGQVATVWCAYVTLDGTPVRRDYLTISAEFQRMIYQAVKGQMTVSSYHVYNEPLADPKVSDYSSRTITDGDLKLRVEVSNLAVTVNLHYSSSIILHFRMPWGFRRGVHAQVPVMLIDKATDIILTGMVQEPVEFMTVDGYATQDRPNPLNIDTSTPWPQLPLNYCVPENFEDHRVELGIDVNITYTADLEQYNEYVPVDPYDKGGESTTGGGDGTFDDTSVPVPIPGLPGISAVDTKFITLYNPSLGELQNLAAYMWSTFDLNAFRKLFADPMDCILGLSIVPVAVPDGGQAEVKVGNIGTGILMNRAASQYVTVDCGSITVEKYWGAYLDYAPYTRAEIYLPYIGAHALAMDDIMDRTIHVVYNIDILSGACAAFIESNGTVLYTFIGQCSSSIPISGNDFTNVINGILSVAGSIGSTVLSGGAAAPAAASSIASQATNVLKPTVEKSGAMAGTGGMLSIQVPYLILTRPKQAIPGSQNREMGYPSFVTRALGTMSGYTEVESVHLHGIPCTSQELVEIEAALKEGVIL